MSRKAESPGPGVAPLRLARARWHWLARQIFCTLPSTRVLHAGADDPALVEALVARGVDAVGYRFVQEEAVATAVGAERFLTGAPTPATESGLDAAFSTVVWSVSCEGFPPGVTAALREIAGVCERHLIVICGGPDGQRQPARVRREVEAWCLANGFRQHPVRLLFASYYEGLDGGPEPWVFERLPNSAGEPLSLPTTSWDPLRESSVAADHTVAKYALAARLVKRLDVVVQAGGAGAGAAILHDSSACASVTIIDDDAAAVAYGRDAYGANRARVSFVEGNPSTLDRAGDCSADVVVAFFPPADLEAWNTLLANAVRVLVPGGRVVISGGGSRVSGGSSCRAFVSRCTPFVQVEHLYAHLAGPTDREDGLDRALAPLASAVDGDHSEADEWILVGVKDSLAHHDPEPAAIDHPRASHPAIDLRAATAGYVNPWLPFGLVASSTRTTSRDLLIELARRTLASEPDHSAERGAALCVLGYRLLEPGNPQGAVDPVVILDALVQFVKVEPRRPIELRWCISNAYVLGRVYLQQGRFRDAECAFARCASLDALGYRPLIATKTVDAAFWAGWLATRRGDHDVARQHWRHGIEAARRALGEGWPAIVGPRDGVTPYGLREAQQVVAAADRCQQALAWVDLDDERIYELEALAFAACQESDDQPWLIRSEVIHSLMRQAREASGGSRELARLLLRRVPGRPIRLWGAGALGRRFIELAGDRVDEVAGFIDSDPAKSGTLFENKPVDGPATLNDAPGASRPYVIVTSRFSSEIASALEASGYTTPDDYFIFPSWP